MSNIVQYIKRTDNTDTLPVHISISSIAGLPTTDHLENNSLFEISVCDTLSADKFSSKKVTWETIMAKLQQTTFNHFNRLYRVLRFNAVNIQNVKDDKLTTIYQFLLKDNNWKGTGEYALPAGVFNTTDEPCVWGDIWTLTHGEIVLSKWMKAMDTRLARLENTKLAFSSNMTFSGTLSVFQDSRGTIRSENITKTMSSCRRDPMSGVNSNGFVVAFDHGQKISTTYVCQNDGLLTLYGWIDSSNVQNIKYLPTAWCALEGEINGQWEILQLQSVEPAKQFSYLGFCIPVMHDLKIRLECGFFPGEASGRYDHGKIPESLANTQPNAFLGGVFSPKYN